MRGHVLLSRHILYSTRADHVLHRSKETMTIGSYNHFETGCRASRLWLPAFCPCPCANHYLSISVPPTHSRTQASKPLKSVHTISLSLDLEYTVLYLSDRTVSLELVVLSYLFRCLRLSSGHPSMVRTRQLSMMQKGRKREREKDKDKRESTWRIIR